MVITNIKKMRSYIIHNSYLPVKTVSNVIQALGYPLTGSGDTFKELSAELVNCAEHGANMGISGFIYYSETIPFFQKNRAGIAISLALSAAEIGTDLISMVQEFGVFHNKDKPTPSEVGKALWDKSKTYPELTDLYNVFAWYALEEVSRAWYRYLEENPVYEALLTA